eukprot:4410767-Alexandrium_andersonii.AAC.1
MARHSPIDSRPRRNARTACQIGASTAAAFGSRRQQGLKTPSTAAIRNPCAIRTCLLYTSDAADDM